MSFLIKQWSYVKGRQLLGPRSHEPTARGAEVVFSSHNFVKMYGVCMNLGQATPRQCWIRSQDTLAAMTFSMCLFPKDSGVGLNRQLRVPEASP